MCGRCHRPVKVYAPKKKKGSGGYDESSTNALQLAVGGGGAKGHAGKGSSIPRPQAGTATIELRDRLVRMLANTTDP
eukprot:9177530-Pyramimonas_sp.AAC.1